METNTFKEIIFWTLAIASVGSALLVVHVQDVFRAALALVVTFIGLAGLFVLLNAEFLAVVQVLIYGGAISVLLIFAVMLTRDVLHGNTSTGVQPMALTVSCLVLGLLVWGIVQSDWNLFSMPLPTAFEQAFIETPQRLGHLLVIDYVLPFEIAGVVLLAAVIGALALVREDPNIVDPDPGSD